MESFPDNWVPVTLKEPPDDKPLTLAQIIPFITPVENLRAKFDGRILWVSYDISEALHAELCQSGYVVYGTREKENMIHISLMSQEQWYWDFIQVVTPEPIVVSTTILDLVPDVVKLICLKLTFTDQLNLRLVCKGLYPLIYYYDFKNRDEGTSSKDSKLMIRVCRDITIKCYAIIWNRYRVQHPKSYIWYLPDEYKKLGECFSKEIKCSSDKKHYWHYDHDYYSGCGNPDHQYLVIFHQNWTLTNIMQNIEQLMIMDKLIKLLDFDKELTSKKNSFNDKDKRLMGEQSKNYKYSYEIQGNCAHFHKTNDCYIKYNKDLRRLFNVGEWFNVVKDMLTGLKPLITMDKIVKIDEAIVFGQKVLENYCEVRKILSEVRRAYFDKHGHGRHYSAPSKESDSD